MSRGLLFTAIALLAGCSGISVGSDYLPGTNFTPYRTYDWMPNAPAPTPEDRLIDTRIRNAVEAGLEAKGFTHSTSGDPDIYVAYQLITDDRTDVRTVNDYYGSSWRYGPYWGPTMSTSRTETVRYTVGTLVLDFFDADSRELVWRGTAEGKLNERANPEDRQERANDAVRRILTRYPPEG